MALRSTYRRLFQRNLAKGQNRAEAKANARKTVEKYRELTKQKKELGLSSREAWEGTRHLERYSNVQRRLLALNPSYAVSLSEASNLFHIWDDTIIKKHFTFSNFLKDYASTRFRGKKVDLKTYRPVAERVLRNLEHSGQFSAEEMESFHESVFGFTIDNRDIRPTYNAASAPIFVRLWKEGSLHRLKSQRWLLEQQFINDLRIGATLPKSRAFGEFVKTGVRGLKKPVSQRTLDQIRKKDPLFDERPGPVREKIVMEARASRLGDQIAERIAQDVQRGLDFDVIEFLKTGGETARKKPTPVKYSIDKTNPYKLGDRPIDFEPYYNTWIIQMLARPGNRKFLAQKAIEWFSKAS